MSCWEPDTQDSRVQALEERIRKLEAKNKELENAFFEEQSTPQLLVDPSSGHIERANKAAVLYYGYQKNELESLCVQDLAQNVTFSSKPHAATEKCNITLKHRLASGSIQDVAITSERIALDDTDYQLCTIRDITQQKEIEHIKEQNKKKYQMIFDNAQDALYIHDLEGNVFDVNQKAIDMLGYSYQEFMSLSPQDLDTKIAKELYEPILQEIKEKGNYLFETTHQTKDGHEIPVEVHANLVDYFDTKAIFAITRDITDRKEKEKQLLQLSTAVEQSPSVIVITDLEGCIEYANPRFTQLTGYTVDEKKGKKTSFLKSGYMNDEDYQSLWSTITAKKIWSGELYNKTKDGTYYWEAASIAPIFDENGEHTHYVKVAEDITKRIEAEKKLQQTLTERTYLLQEIHHRVKNNLTIISSLFNLQLQKVDDDSVKSDLRDAQNRIRSMAMIHEQLYGSSNFSDINFKPYVSELIQNIELLYQPSDRGNINKQIRIADDIHLDIKRAIPCGLILNELLTNEYKHAFPPGQDGMYSIDFKRVDDSYNISLEDNGVGLPSDFEHVRNSTMGLIIVDGLVSQLDGTVQYNSKKNISGSDNQGTVIQIEFPVY